MKRVFLREDVALNFLADSCEIHGVRGVKFQSLTCAQMQLLRCLWSDGVPAASLQDLTKIERAVFKILSNKRLLRISEPDYSRNEIWLSHYVADARAAMGKLRCKRVMIVDCGGTGAIIADHLTRAGVHEFVLVDGATLDAPDLNRQWTFSAHSIGRPKAELLANHIEQISKKPAEIYNKYLAQSSDLADLKTEICDLIVWCADKPQFAIELLALELAETHGTPLLFGSVGIVDDQVGPLVLTALDRERERERIIRAMNRGYFTPIMRGSIAFTNTIAAAKIGLLAFEFLVGAKLA